MPIPKHLPKQILHCADDVADPSRLVLLYACRDGYESLNERSLRYTDIGSAALMLGFILTEKLGWKTRVIQLSKERAERYLASRRELHIAECI